VDIGNTTLKRAADLFAGGDVPGLKVRIIVYNAALVDGNMLEAETVETINAIFNVNGSSSRVQVNYVCWQSNRTFTAGTVSDYAGIAPPHPKQR
jgi:hypothetical protein